MTEEKEKQFLKSMDEIIMDSLKTDVPLTRSSETMHTISSNNTLKMTIYEASRRIEIKAPYSIMPPNLQQMIDKGIDAGYQVKETY